MFVLCRVVDEKRRDRMNDGNLILRNPIGFFYIFLFLNHPHSILHNAGRRIKNTAQKQIILLLLVL
jgi:hypothetical protein